MRTSQQYLQAGRMGKVGGLWRGVELAEGLAEQTVSASEPEGLFSLFLTWAHTVPGILLRQSVERYSVLPSQYPKTFRRV